MYKNKNTIFKTAHDKQNMNPEGTYITLDTNTRAKRAVIAGSYNGYLTWPGTKIPFIDRAQLVNHIRKKQIEMKIEAALSNDELIDALWNDSEILAITLRCKL